jgi:hypothetical protein
MFSGTLGICEAGDGTTPVQVMQQLTACGVQQANETLEFVNLGLGIERKLTTIVSRFNCNYDTDGTSATKV